MAFSRIENMAATPDFKTVVSVGGETIKAVFICHARNLEALACI